MKRPVLVRILLAVQVLAATTLLVFAAYLFWRSFLPHSGNKQWTGDAVHGMRVLAGQCTAIALAFGLAALALWKRWKWGLWYAVLVYLGFSGLLVYIFADDWSEPEVTEIVLVAYGIVIAGLHFAKSVRREFQFAPVENAELLTGKEV